GTGDVLDRFAARHAQAIACRDRSPRDDRGASWNNSGRRDGLRQRAAHVQVEVGRPRDAAAQQYSEVISTRRIGIHDRGPGFCVAAAVAAVCATLAFAPTAYAEKADREKPINFSGDTGDANLQSRGGTLAGHVIITQGTLEIRADRIVFRQNADNSLSATAYGNPVALRQKRDGVDEYYEGYAQRLEYDGSKELVELFDNALLKRGQDEIRSNYVSYNTATELF